MPKTLLNEQTAHVEARKKGSERSGMSRKGPDDQRENLEYPSISVPAPAPSDKESDLPAAVPATSRQSDEAIENLMSLFRDFLEAPNKGVSGFSHNIAQENKEWRKKLLGLNKGLGFSQETGSNTNKYDYEQKYPRDRPGEEVADNSRIWLTYLDEAESFDHERAEMWKDTVDVLLVFAGLFSGVITTFISQASQSLQKDNTQVSASLLSEAVQLLRANFSGVPASQVPSSTLTPTSPFTPSTNTLLVNALWFTSLTITLTTALFAVIAKQWLHYYLSSIRGTVNEKVRARQLRLNGFESWKVPIIIDILPILLHLAVGLFLTGIIILLFPLDIRISWTILIITSVTYTLYFISVMLPIWYAECPYTSSLTIYTGFLFLVLRQISQNIITILKRGLQRLSRKINIKSRRTVGHLVHYIRGLVQHGFMFIAKLAGPVRRGFQRLRSTIFSRNMPKLTKWREENIKKVVENAAFLDFDALRWLHATSSNQSVHRIIARSVAVHPFISKRFDGNDLDHLRGTLEISKTNVVDLRYGLCLDLAAQITTSWKLLRSIPPTLQSQLEEGEYQTYLQIERIGCYAYNEPETLSSAIRDDLSLPLTMWCHLFKETSPDATVAVDILTHGTRGLFNWKFNLTHQLTCNAGLVRFNSKELGWWKFERLFSHFELGNPDYSSEVKTYETCYLLLITIYRNITSDHSLITDKADRQDSLSGVFASFSWRFHLSKPIHTCENTEYYFTYFKDICCVDSFWCEPMTDRARRNATNSLYKIYFRMNTLTLDNHLTFVDGHDLSLIYQWYSRDLDPDLPVSCLTPPLFVLLLVPQNRRHLSTILLNDPDAVSHFSKSLYNLANFEYISKEIKTYEALMNLFKSVNSRNPLFTILYHPSVLEQLWKLLVFSNWDTNRYFLLVVSRIDRVNLDELFVLMNGIVQSDDLANLAPKYRSLTEIANGFRVALEISVRDFGQIIAENAASDKINDTREHVHATGHKTPHSIANWTRKLFEFMWPKTSVIPTDQSRDV